MPTMSQEQITEMELTMADLIHDLERQMDINLELVNDNEALILEITRIKTKYPDVV